MSKTYEIGELDHYLFGQGNHYEIYKKMGSHVVTDREQSGVYFAVWAPNAKSVSLVGDFNAWTPGIEPMKRKEPLGIYTCFVPNIGEGALYKYCIETKNGDLLYKSDPFDIIH